jgi:hypothetical protein
MCPFISALCYSRPPQFALVCCDILTTLLVYICFVVVLMCVCTEWINSFDCCTALINEE